MRCPDAIDVEQGWAGDDGEVVFAVPAPLVAAFANLDADSEADLARHWGLLWLYESPDEPENVTLGEEARAMMASVAARRRDIGTDIGE